MRHVFADVDPEERDAGERTSPASWDVGQSVAQCRAKVCNIGKRLRQAPSFACVTCLDGSLKMGACYTVIL